MNDTTQDVRSDDAPPVVNRHDRGEAATVEVKSRDPGASITVSFTKFEAHGDRLSKLYELGADGKVIKIGGTQISNGRYETVSIEAANPQAALAEIGARIDVLNFREAIGLGVVCDGTSVIGRHHHQGQVREAQGRQARQRRSRGRCRIFAGLRTVVVCCCSTATKQTDCARFSSNYFRTSPTSLC